MFVRIVYVLSISDADFARLIGEAMDELPEAYVRNLDNVAVTYADEPTPEQREELRLRGGQTLFGLYQGVPRTSRGAGYNMMLPDKITLFKHPILWSIDDEAGLKKQIKHTLWHEIAHHYGLDHDRIHELEDKPEDK